MHGNKYLKIPSPDKKELEDLYNIAYMSEPELAIKYGFSIKVIQRWFRELGIQPRKAFKRNQIGSNNDTWKGDNVTYAAFHKRVVALKGRPKECEVCGTTDENKKYDWACISNYTKVEDYKRMCRSCHWKHDKIGNNFPNNDRIPNDKSKKIKKHASS
jgi:hypothetical protein